MSQPTAGQNQTPAYAQQANSQALLDELRVAADRARDERLKLARMFKHTEALPVNGSAPEYPVPDERIANLSSQIECLEAAVADKLDALSQVQQDIDSRTQYLESLRHTITDTTRAFVTQVEQAQHFKAHVDAAKQHVRMSAGRVVDDVRGHLAEFEQPIAERIQQLNELDEQIDKRIARMQQMHKQAGEAVDKHLLAALRSAKEQAADLTAPMKEEIDKYLTAQRATIEAAIHKKISELDVDVEEALSPLTSKFNEIVSDAQAQADLLADTLPDRLESIMNEQSQKLREQLAEQATAALTGMDEQVIERAQSVMREKVAQSLDNYLAQADREAGGYVDGLIAKLEDARQQGDAYAQSLGERLQAMYANSDGLCEQLNQRLNAAVDEAVARFGEGAREIEVDLQIDREQMLAKLDEEVQRVHALADDRVDHARKVLEEASDSIHGRAAAAVDAALQAADTKLDEYETAAVEHLRVIDDGIEHSIEATRKRIADMEKQSLKQGDEAARIAEQAIAGAQQRLTGFEAGITQRIAIASQSVDEAVSSVDGRLDRMEQDATARVMKIVDLAETSGQAVAESIDALAKSADETAARAQADLEAKLAAFEEISAEALKNAEQTLRSNIGELRDSSRAMIEMVSRQVKAQAGEIEPQTKEVITHAEQTMRRRIGELRDSAQSMVDITVNRLESQLEAVKSKAQQTAFEGIDGRQGNEAA